MKKAKTLLNIIFLALMVTFVSCEKEIDKTSTHTDVSGLVGGTYTGSISLGDNSYGNVTIVIDKYNAESVQAVSITIKSPDFTYNGAAGLDLPAFINTDLQIVNEPVYMNAAKANDGYVFSCTKAGAVRLNGRLTANNLVMQVPILVFSSKTLFHTNGDDWQFVGTKN